MSSPPAGSANEGGNGRSRYTLMPPPNQDIVLVGATGDLARRKLIPAIYDLYLDGLLPDYGQIIGYARSEGDDESFRALAVESIATFARRPLYDEAWAELAHRLCYVSRSDGGFAAVARRAMLPQRIVFLATPPSAVPSTVAEIAATGLAQGTRLVVEKPFGFDLKSARELDETLHRDFRESQIFRIDHYMGKETVQNILVFRFGNALWERVWNRDAIDHVQITVAESLGVEGRGSFYEEVGALRDIIQNHAMQVLSLLTMEPPAAFDMHAIRDETAKVLMSMKPVDPSDVVRGQYEGGSILGVPVPGYRDEEGVTPTSQTETFVALRAEIDNWRWAGVPFFLRTGKRLRRRVTEVQIVFRDAPVRLFEAVGIAAEDVLPNRLTMRIQPDDGISFTFMAKSPGPEITLQPVRMNFRYDDSFMTEPSEAYERLLYDAMDGDAMLFLRSDIVDRAWEVLEPVLHDMPPVEPYGAGTWGPEAADRLIEPRHWRIG